MLNAALRIYKPLRDTVEEVEAVACTDRTGRVHWVRIFEPLISSRGVRDGARMESPNGMPVFRLRKGGHLLFSADAGEWISVVRMYEAGAN